MDLDSYLVNIPKNYAIRGKNMFQTIRDYKLKAIKGIDDQYYVAFTDIYKEFIKKAFERHFRSDFKVDNENIKKKLKKGWKKE